MFWVGENDFEFFIVLGFKNGFAHFQIFEVCLLKKVCWGIFICYELMKNFLVFFIRAEKITFAINGFIKEMIFFKLSMI